MGWQSRDLQIGHSSGEPLGNVIKTKNKKIEAIHRDLVCWASDLELGPKVMRVLVKGGAVAEPSDVCPLKSTSCARPQQGDGACPVGIAENPGEGTQSHCLRGRRSQKAEIEGGGRTWEGGGFRASLLGNIPHFRLVILFRRRAGVQVHLKSPLTS